MTKLYELGELPRNNHKAALATRRAMIAAGTWQDDYGQYIIMLQDDPTELLDALAREPA